MTIRFFRPRSLDEALTLMADLGATAYPVGGGTDLLLKLRHGRAAPGHLVGLGDVGLAYVRGPNGDEPTVEIGAMAPLAMVAGDEAVRRHLPALASACLQVGSPQIQAVGTIGGNIGNASPCADTATPLLVQEARVRLASKAGVRELPLDEFFLAPGRTARRPDELLVAIVAPLPPLAPGRRVKAYFRKYGPRRANVISAVNFAARLELEGATVTAARVAFGSVAPTPLRARRTEEWLEGRALCEELVRDPALAVAVHEDIAPIDDVRGSRHYKTTLAANSVRYALSEALSDATEREEAQK